jgi:biopolymer transport protein ExbD
MRFPRNARISKGSLEAAPWAAVMFLLIIFIMLCGLLYTPGVRVQLPMADELPGIDGPSIRVAMDSAGRLYYRNQVIDENALVQTLSEFAKAAPEKPTLVVEADKQATYDQLIHLTRLARKAGIENALLATLPSTAGKTIPQR